MNLKDKILVRNSTLFNITIPPNNKFEVDPGVYPAEWMVINLTRYPLVNIH